MTRGTSSGSRVDDGEVEQASPTPQLPHLPPRSAVRVRNLTKELAVAQVEPTVRAAREAVEKAHAELAWVQGEWSKETAGLAVGGQASMDVAARQAELSAAEAGLLGASEALTAAERSGGARAEILQARSLRDHRQRRVEQLKKAVTLARQLTSIDEKRNAKKARLQEAQDVFKVAGVRVESLTVALRGAEASAVPLPPPFLAVRGPPGGLSAATSVAALEDLLWAEWCVGVPSGDSELVAPAEDVLALLEGSTDEADEGAGPREVAVLLFEEENRAPPSEGDCVVVQELHRAGVRADADVVSSLVAVSGTRAERPRSMQLLRAWLRLSPGVRVEAAVAEALERLLRPQDLSPPVGLQAELRPYQLQGLQWLASNAGNGFGSLLADDMGLGKTLQAIALVLHLRERGLLDRPALVVAPLSVLGNWEAELLRWAPALRCRLYHRVGRELLAVAEDADVVLTTYQIVQRDVEALCGSGKLFGAMLLDEAQAIKNARSQTAQAIKRVAAEAVGPVRVALSGTPVENRLAELHAILDFTLPGYLGLAASFEVEFARPLERSLLQEWEREQVRNRLLAAIRPFVLRRCKTDPSVAPDLPEKIEIAHGVELTAAQRQLYTAIKEAALEVVSQIDHGPAAPEGLVELLEELSRPPTPAAPSAQPQEAMPTTQTQKEILPRPDGTADVVMSSAEGAAAGAADGVATSSEAGQPPVADLPPAGAPSQPVSSLEPADGVVEIVEDEPGAIEVVDVDQFEAAPREEAGTVSRTGPRGSQRYRASQVMAMLHGLQQVCNHPAAVTEARWPAGIDRVSDAFGPAAQNSGKAARLLEILEEAVDPPREKALIFTQYIQTLQLLQSLVSAAHPTVEVLTLHGELNRTQRDLIVRRFQEEPQCAVLISTLGVGGVGLNLTAATHVIHYDRCWNPAKEAQATDRAYRIGQQRTVVVHRLISQGTLEERLAEVLQRKSALASEVVPIDSVVTDIAHYSLDELRHLLDLTAPPRPQPEEAAAAPSLG